MRRRGVPTPAGDGAFIDGARSLLFDYARMSGGESALLVFDPRVSPVCKALEAMATHAGVMVSSVPADVDWTAISARLDEGCDAVLFLELDASHHTRALVDDLSARGQGPRAYRLFGATADTIRHGFRREQDLLCRRNWGLVERARRAGRVAVESALGTCIEVGLDPLAPWTNTYGEPADGYPGILPPAEVNTRSAGVNGTLVVDGAIGSNIGWPLDVRLRRNPITLRIAGGKVVELECRNTIVRDLVEELLGVPGCNEVVEIGIGTNDGIRGFLATDTVLNERVASFHLGMGNTDETDQAGNLHIDFILDDCCIRMGEEIVLESGRFLDDATAPIPDRRSYEVQVKLHDAL
jgi:hypothetical protein